MLIALGVAAIVVAFWSLERGGIGWDSRFDTNAALVIRSVDSSWSAKRAYDAVPLTSEFYGVFPQQAADVLHRLVTGSSVPLQPDDAVTYRYQGIVNVVLMVAAVSALGYALAVGTGSWLAAAFAWALTLSTPLWLGMSHVDFKDGPVAAGFTFVSAGLVLGFSLRPTARAALVGSLVAGAGGAIAIATRPGAFVPLLALVWGTTFAAAVGVVVARRLARPVQISVLPALITSTSALGLGLLFTFATNPIARIDTLDWLRAARTLVSAYPVAFTIRTLGRDLPSADLPWWYVPAWLGAQLPLLTLGCLLGAGVLLAVDAWRRRSILGLTPRLALVVPIVLQGIGLPLAIIVSGAALYDGIRHILFAIPALMAIPALALARVDRQARHMSFGAHSGLAAIAVVTVALSLTASIRWAPYSYAYLNVVAGRNASERPWELDYWGVSGREGVTRLQALGFTKVRVRPTNDTGIPWIASDGGDDGPSGVYVFSRPSRDADYGCTPIFTIERGGHVLGEGARCTESP